VWQRWDPKSAGGSSTYWYSQKKFDYSIERKLVCRRGLIKSNA